MMPLPEHMHRAICDIALSAGGPLLAFDAAGKQLSVCLVAPVRNLIINHVAKSHAQPLENLLPTILHVLHEAAMQLADIHAIVVGLGPGSFTGLRVAMATAKGLAMGCDIPLYGVSSFATWAVSLHKNARIACMLQAQQQDVFAAVFDIDTQGLAHTLVEQRLWARDAFCLFCEDTYAIKPIDLDGQPLHMAYGIVQAAQAIAKGQCLDMASAVPSYIGLSAAEKNI